MTFISMFQADTVAAAVIRDTEEDFYTWRKVHPSAIRALEEVIPFCSSSMADAAKAELQRRKLKGRS